MRHLLLISLTLFFLSCDNENEATNNTSELLGNYKFVSLTSNTALDLNLDGLATTDFKNELVGFYSTYFHPVMRIKEVQLGPTNYFLEVIIPKPSFFPEYNDYDINYLSRGHEAYINFIRSSNQLNFSIGNNEAYQLQNGSPIIKDIKVLTNNQIRVDCTQRFYHHPEGWYDTYLVGIYEKD